MENFLDQATLMWKGLFAGNASDTALASLTSYGNLGTAGFLNPTFQYSAGGRAVCVSGDIKVPVKATNTILTYEGPKDNYELTEFFANLFRIESDGFVRYLGGQREVSDTFDIYAKLCIPEDRKDATFSTLQFLTHGGMLDHSYWDFASGYSYIDAAADEGYATFSYDRLGTGQSQHPDPLQIVQASIQVDIAHVIVQKLKSGELGGMAFEQVVGVGHSFGSAITQGVSSRFPDDFNALIHSGTSAFLNGIGVALAAAAQQIANTVSDRPDLKGLANGYITRGHGVQTLQYGFFYYPEFDPEILHKQYRSMQTNALGEALTGGTLMAPVPHYKNPVLFMNGKQDYIFCLGNCDANGGITAQALATLYPNAASSSKAVNIPGIGHNINQHLKRGEAFTEMLNFLKDSGIKP